MVRRDLTPVALDQVDIGEELSIDGRDCEKSEAEAKGVAEAHSGGRDGRGDFDQGEGDELRDSTKTGGRPWRL